MATWGDVLADTRRQLGDGATARWMVEEASGYRPIGPWLGDVAPAEATGTLDGFVERFRAGEPLAYVLGRWGFRHLDLFVDRRVLIPRPETEIVAAIALDLAGSMPRPLTVADLGTGSGAIGLSLAAELRGGDVTVWLADASSAALDVARTNLTALRDRASRVMVAPSGDWFDALPAGTVVDLAVANPPYIAAGSPLVDDSVSDWEPHAALFAGPDGLDDIRRIVATAPSWIRKEGWLVLEIGYDQGDAVSGLLSGAGFTDVTIRPDLAGRDRVAVGRAGPRPLIQPSSVRESARSDSPAPMFGKAR